MNNNKSILNYMTGRLNIVLARKEELLSRKSKMESELENIQCHFKTTETDQDKSQEVFSPISRIIKYKQKENQISLLKKTQLTTLIDCYDQELELISQEESELIKHMGEGRTEYCELSIKEEETFNQNYGMKILEQQESERQRIARDLHDSTVQNLTNLVHKTELCMRIMDMDPIRAKLELEIINNTIRYTINDMRNIIHNLRPMSFDDFGLEVTLSRVVNQIRNNTEIEIHLTISGEKVMIPAVKALTLVRVIQEACNNSIKYSDASNIYIDFIYSEDNIELSVEDDGIGFDMNGKKNEDNKSNSNLGISIMKERINLLSGEFGLNSEPGKGTKIKVIVPL